MKRRTLVRLLVGLGFGIPIAIEGATFLGLLNDTLFGGGDGDSAETTATPVGDPVAVGETFLPETGVRERLSTATIVSEGGEWTLVLTVLVENESERPYRLHLGSVRTDGGRSIPGDASTGVVEPGESTTVTGQWSLSPGSTPRTLAVRAEIGSGPDRRTIERRIRLADIAVQSA